MARPLSSRRNRAAAGFLDGGPQLEEFGLPAWPDISGLDSDEDNVLGSFECGRCWSLQPLWRMLVPNCGLSWTGCVPYAVISYIGRDTVASAALKSLAQNADYLIVDTWQRGTCGYRMHRRGAPTVHGQNLASTRGGHRHWSAAIEDALIAQTSDVDLNDKNLGIYPPGTTIITCRKDRDSSVTATVLNHQPYRFSA